MKVIHLISGGDSGGAKTHVLTLLTHLRQLNIDVELLCIMESIFTEEARELGIPITVIPQAKRWDISVIGKIRSYIAESGCDLVHCHGARANYIALFIMNSLKVPMITTLHSDYKLDFKDNARKQLIYTPINSFALRRFKHILTVTKSFRNMLIQRGFKADRLEVIYNGIEFDEELSFYSKEEFYEKIGVPYDDKYKYVGIAARLFAVKGVDVFLKAAKYVCDKCGNIRFVVLGDGDMMQQCREYINQNKLDDKVFMAGQIKDAKLMTSYYKAIDVNTLTSYSESFPYALLEGARCGCATIATAVGGIPEMISDGKDGLLATSGDAAGIGECMIALCENDAVRNELGNNFYNTARKSFSAEAMAKTHKDIYSKIINNSKKENVK